MVFRFVSSHLRALSSPHKYQATRRPPSSMRRLACFRIGSDPAMHDLGTDFKVVSVMIAFLCHCKLHAVLAENRFKSLLSDLRVARVEGRHNRDSVSLTHKPELRERRLGRCPTAASSYLRYSGSPSQKSTDRKMWCQHRCALGYRVWCQVRNNSQCG